MSEDKQFCPFEDKTICPKTCSLFPLLTAGMNLDKFVYKASNDLIASICIISFK